MLVGGEMRIIVAGTAYNRPDYLRQVMAGWELVRGDFQMLWCVEPSERQHEIGSIVSVPNTAVFLNREVLGPLRNPYKAINLAFGWGADAVLVAEDDTLPSNDILEYIQAAFAMKQESDLIVCCNSANDDDPRLEYGITRDKDFCPSLWAVHKDDWPLVRDTWDHDYSTGENGVHGGWDWNLNLRVMPQHNKTALFPMQSRSQHIGEFGGAHMIPEHFPESQTESFLIHREPGVFWLNEEQQEA